MEIDGQWLALHSRKNVWQRNSKTKSLKDKLYSGNNMVMPEAQVTTIYSSNDPKIGEGEGREKYLNCTGQNQKENWR